MDKASEMMAVTAPSLLSRGFIDAVIDEPTGGAHLDRNDVLQVVRDDIQRN